MAEQRTHTIRQGEDLLRVAVIYYGDWTRWRELAYLNEIRDPAMVTVGQRIRLLA